MKIWYYLLVFIMGLGIDRTSKWWAITTNADCTICPYLNFSLLWNRGVSWGIFHEASAPGFYLLTAFIIIITLGLMAYSLYHQWYQRNIPIFFETMVITGSISNIIDRFMFGGVVDFIQFHVGEWYFPTFNIADVFVVCGVMCMVIQTIARNSEIKH